jgi:hypothetical protein
VENQADVPATLPMAMERKPHMADHRVCPAVCYHVDGLAHIDQARNRSFRDTVIHRYDDRFFRIPVHDSFKTNFLSSHSNNNLPLHSRFILTANQRA